MRITPKIYEALNPIFHTIAAKYTPDVMLQQDCVQQTWLEISAIPKHRLRDKRTLNAFLRTVCRNTTLSMLTSYTTGNWYCGRTNRGPDGNKSLTEPRYVRLGSYLASEAVQIREDGAVVAGEGTEEDYQYFMQGDENREGKRALPKL